MGPGHRRPVPWGHGACGGATALRKGRPGILFAHTTAHRRERHDYIDILERVQSVDNQGGRHYPFGTENQRGYVISRFRVEANRTLGAAVLNYAHNKSPLRFPYFDTEEGILNGAKDYRWHFTNFHTTAYCEAVGG